MHAILEVKQIHQEGEIDRFLEFLTISPEEQRGYREILQLLYHHFSEVIVESEDQWNYSLTFSGLNREPQLSEEVFFLIREIDKEHEGMVEKVWIQIEHDTRYQRGRLYVDMRRAL